MEETAKTASNTPHSSTFSSFSSPDVPVSDQASAAMLGMVGEDTPLSSPSPSNRTAPKKSQMDIIYSENKVNTYQYIVDLCTVCVTSIGKVKVSSKRPFIG